MDKDHSYCNTLRLVSKKWEFTTSHLKASQRKDPIATMDYICGAITLFDARKRLNDQFQAAITSSLWKDDDTEEKKEKISFFEELMQLLECIYLLNQMIIEEKLTYSIKKKK